jgi:hypothetical protein
MNKLKKNPLRLTEWWTVWVIALIPWIIFFTFFADQKVSFNISDWSAFGSYIGGTVAALTIPFSFYLLIKTYQTQKKSELTAINTLENQKFEKRLFELIGVFNEYRYNHLKGWVINGEKPREDYN